MPATRRLTPKCARAGTQAEIYALARFFPSSPGGITPLAGPPAPAELPQALVSQYFQDCRSDLAQLKAALAVGDYETARRLGHQMKGTGQPYGFPGLTQIGRAIEWAASKRAAPELGSRIERLQVCLNRIELASERD